MKKLFVIFLVFSITLPSIAQNKSSKLNKGIKVRAQVVEILPEDKLQCQADYVRHCLNQYRKKQLTGIEFEIGGLLIMAVTQLNSVNGTKRAEINYWDNMSMTGNSLEGTVFSFRQYEMDLEDANKIRNIGAIVGGATFLTGAVIQVLGYKWLKNAYVGADGLGIKFMF